MDEPKKDEVKIRGEVFELGPHLSEVVETLSSKREKTKEDIISEAIYLYEGMYREIYECGSQVTLENKINGTHILVL